MKFKNSQSLHPLEHSYNGYKSSRSPEPAKTNHHIHLPMQTLPLPHSSNSMAYKTLHIFYQTILENNIQKPKKEDFELHAKQLSIIDRNNKR